MPSLQEIFQFSLENYALRKQNQTQRPARGSTEEILDWQPHSPEVLQNMRNHLEELKRLGIEAIN
ncbi:hypothetical protein [Pseudarthrobacter sp. PvP090]|uniref:hypothetical protein n=1 Tax=Pseudarthrobacter sp. PvP090 TaxID=3156393 RepID=UPI00339752AD